jgi:hypothetical protein
MMASAGIQVNITGLPQVEQALNDAGTLINDLRSLLQAWEPRVRCPQCGQRYSGQACGTAHAAIIAMISGDR